MVNFCEKLALHGVVMDEIVNQIDSSVITLALAQSFNAVILTDAGHSEVGHRIVYANKAFLEMTGYSEEEILGKNPNILQGAGTSREVISRLRHCLNEGIYFQGSTINYRKDGRPYSVEWNISPVRNKSGVVTHFISVQQDISSLIAAQKTAQLFAHVLNATDDGVLITDSYGAIQFVNKGFEKITGYSISEVLGRNPNILKSGQQDAYFYDEMWAALKKGQSYRETFVNINKYNETIYCDETITPLTDEFENITHYVSIFRDQTTKVLEEQNFREMVRFDHVTGALTRAAGELALEKAFIQAVESKFPVAIVLADIDHFKKVNDTWGHSTGDVILRKVADAFSSVLRASDSVVRWGGEEFLLIFSGCSLEKALPLAERCRLFIQENCKHKGSIITISLGIGELQIGEALPDLIERVDKALYRAKKFGRNQVNVSNM